MAMEMREQYGAAQIKNMSEYNKGEVDFVNDVQDTFSSEPHGDG